jgi:type III pantothenate kinase
MDLLIDIGNTRIKWALLDGQRLSHQQAAPYAEWDATHVRNHLLTTAHRPLRVFVANVGGDAIGSLVANTLVEHCGTAPQFIHATLAAAGIRNAYRHPEKLGVDRWLAMIGSFQLERRATCIVSVGTAMTVDGVDQNGNHLGGIIVPGPDLMAASLYRNTSDIALRAADGTPGSDLFADNTQAAVHQGAAHSLAAVIERACHDMQSRLGQMPALLVTGGASGRVTGALRVAFRLVPDLVLRGMAELARSQENNAC